MNDTAKSVARHARPAHLVDASLEDIMATHVGRFKDKTGDWNAFADASVPGWHRAQYRFIGAGASGKHNDGSSITPGNFTLSIMEVPPGQGNASHTHEVEEVFFTLQGELTVWVEDESGRRVSAVLKPWEMICCPAGVIHGYQNDTDATVFLQVMLGRGKPETAGFASDALFKQRDSHLEARPE